jgi:aspartate/methionine/tyrosine aminotransferase
VVPASHGAQCNHDPHRGGQRQIKANGLHPPFYTFPNISHTGWPSKKLADALLDEASVAALKGTAFPAFGEGYLRFSVANSV